MDKNRRALALYLTVFAVAFLLAVPFLNLLATGATFSFQSQLTSDNVEQERIRTAVVGSGSTAHIYMVYEDRNTAGINTPHVFFKRSINGGSSFEAPFDFLSGVTNTNQKQVWPSIAVHEGITQNTLAAVYLDNSDDQVFLDYKIMCRISTNGGSTWSTGYEVSGPQNNYKEIQVTFDHNGNLFVLYYRGSYYNVVFSTDFGQTWSSSQQVILPAGNPDTLYRLASIAADGTSVGVAYQSNPNWKGKIFFTKAPTTNLGSGVLSWSDPLLINYIFGSDPEGWNPVLTAEKDVFHLTWWDFETDAGGAYAAEDTFKKDKPCVKYTRSTDHGVSFKVGSNLNIIVNEPDSPTYWISIPWMDTSSSGKIAIMWVDLSRGYPNFFVTVSADNGATWSKPNRANSYFPEQEFLTTLDDPNPDANFRVGIDTGDNLYCTWLARPSSTEDKEIMFSRSIVNTPPVAISDLKVRDFDETWGDVQWSINREPDFMEYRTHISTTQGFVPNYVPFPAGTLYNVSKNQMMQYELFKNLEPDAPYYIKVEVVDDENVTSVSNEVTFKTLRVNVAPIFSSKLDTMVIELNEDSKLVKAINVSDWVDYTPYAFETRYDFAEGKYIKDDWYNDIYELYFELESEEEDAIVLGNLYDEWHGQNYYYVDFNSNPNFKDQSGDVRFRLKVTDPGKDGSLQSVKDNKANTSYWFTVRVLSTNDVPEWKSFTDLMIGTGKLTDMSRVTDILTLDDANTSCIEEQEYSFRVNCLDVDGDFIKLEVQTGDPMKSRIAVKRDTVDPRRAAVFTFTPQDSDLPLVKFNITANDEKGGIINVTIVIPVKNLNDEPFFLTVNGEAIGPKGDTVVFEALEKSTLQFNVTGWDIDPSELLTLSASPSTTRVVKTGPGAWDVSYIVPDYTTRTSTLNLLLRDRQGSFADLTVTVNIKDVPQPPQFTDPIIMRPLYDATDVNEWGGVGGKFIRPEFGEPVEFEAFAIDPDGDLLNFTWRFSNEKENINWTLYGKKVSMSFYPTQSKLSYAKREKFRVNLSVSDSVFGAIYGYIETWVELDDDNDNDGLPDNRELWFYNLIVDPESGRPEKPEAWKEVSDDSNWQKFADQMVQNYKDQQVLLTEEVKAEPLLLFKPGDDLDMDRTEDNFRYTNKDEMGFNFPQQETELERTQRVNTYSIDPLDPLVWPGHQRVDPDPTDVDPPPPPPPTWLIIGASIIVLIIITGVLVVIFILRREKVIEKREDEDLEKRVKDHEKRQAVIQGMYGVQKAGDAIGPDQSTLSDLTLDMGGEVYHEEGSHTLTVKRKEDEKTGPRRERSDSGPLFEKSAPKLDLTESLKLETIDISDDVTQMDHSGVDEDALGASMDDLMDAAKEFDPNAVKNAGGNVMVGALPMEEQMKLRQQGSQLGGPRLPPPGQEGVPMAPPPRPPMPGAPPLPQQMPPKRPQQ